MTYQQHSTGHFEQPAAARVDTRDTHTGNALRVFQFLAAAGGAVLFVMGLIAVFRVDFGAGFLDTSGSVAGFGFSPAAAVAAIVLGGGIMAAALAAQDRATTAVLGLLTVLVGIGAMVASGEVEGVQVDRDAALMFVVLGAAVFVLGLLPWVAGRRRVTTYSDA
jgi:hypothetical protein